MGNALIRRPMQERSRRTEDNVLEATRRLLETKWFSEISLGEIAKVAGCGVGTVYGRFVSKDALLQVLKQDFLLATKRAHEEVVNSPELAGKGLNQRVEKLVAMIVDSYRQHRGIVRELVIGAHGHKASDDQRIGAAMTELLNGDIEFLLSALPIKKRKSSRKQVGMAVLAAINLIQNRIVFQETSPLEFSVSDRDLKQEIPKMVTAYLANLIK
ncbi:MAG: TetR/AcrR family transcriptional regulator [Pirellulaceae bacterium]|nr:TetR/AcrR family transcriptional regulator [Pirellulaceae bacterium]